MTKDNPLEVILSG